MEMNFITEQFHVIYVFGFSHARRVVRSVSFAILPLTRKAGPWCPDCDTDIQAHQVKHLAGWSWSRDPALKVHKKGWHSNQISDTRSDNSDFFPDFKCNKRNGHFFGPNRVVFWGSYSVFAYPLSISDSRFEIKNGSLGPRTFHFKASWLKALCEIGSLAISHQRMVFSECELVGNSTKFTKTRTSCKFAWTLKMTLKWLGFLPNFSVVKMVQVADSPKCLQSRSKGARVWLLGQLVPLEKKSSASSKEFPDVVFGVT